MRAMATQTAMLKWLKIHSASRPEAPSQAEQIERPKSDDVHSTSMELEMTYLKDPPTLNDLGAHFESTVQDRNRTDSIRPRPVSPESHREGAHLPLYCLKMFADCRFKGSSELFLCAATDLHEFWIPSQAHAIQPLHA